MRKTLAPLALALLVVSSVNSEDAKDKNSGDAKNKGFDAAKLVGDWKIAEGKRNGDPISEMGMKTPIKVTKDTFTLGTGDQKFVMAYKLDTKASPVAIDISIKEGPVNEGKALGIIAVDGNKVKLCYVVDDGSNKRPTKFESTKDNNAANFVLEPKK
jgi:uncharacterized protein (TIGR03067 family)